MLAKIKTIWVCKLNSVRSFFSSISNVSFFLKDSTLISFFEQDQGSVKGGDLRSRLYTLDRFLSLSTFAFQSLRLQVDFHSIAKFYTQLLNSKCPILKRLGPFFRDVSRGQIDQFQKGHVKIGRAHV
jgi:hypothetical protein